MERVEAVAAVLTANRFPEDAPPRGLPPELVDEVERDQPAPLGAAYRRWLELAGADAGWFMVGTDFCHPRILGLRESTRELFTGDGSDFRPDAHDRVIAMHQGYQVVLLRGEGDDPQVWQYQEGDTGGRPHRTHERFTDWLREELDAAWPIHARLAARVVGRTEGGRPVYEVVAREVAAEVPDGGVGAS